MSLVNECDDGWHIFFCKKLQINNKYLNNMARKQVLVENWGGVNDIIQVDETETISIAGGDLYEEKNVVNIM